MTMDGWTEVAGRARKTFEQHAETAGLEPPPRGKLENYAAELLAQIPQLRAGCSEGADEKLHALTEMQAAAAGLLAYIEGEQARGAARAARGTARVAKAPVPAAQASAATRLAARAAARRAAMRGRR